MPAKQSRETKKELTLNKSTTYLILEEGLEPISRPAPGKANKALVERLLIHRYLLLGLPRGWTADRLKTFLQDQVSPTFSVTFLLGFSTLLRPALGSSIRLN